MFIIQVKLISYPEETELIAKMAGLICYSGEKVFEKIKEKAALKPDEYLAAIIKSGHLSIIEHNVFVFYISGISRVTSHQLIRKRLASFSQQSQRYVSAENFEYIIPEDIKQSPFAEKYKDIVNQSHELYQEMVSTDITKEDARYILPNATSTQLIASMNGHALIDLLVRRICLRSQWEIRELAELMLDEVTKVAPTIFKNLGAFCDFYGYCPENSHSCGKVPTIDELKKQASFK
ncbi:MAG: FAD-dependent thymidylate synthase [Candidatus Heimdallarchaeota archaeon]|nr:FAD-dependent thymidylate synthase [Candidatus Heimdallarchaeota archaeon]